MCLSVGYDYVEGLAASWNCAVCGGPCVSWELEVLIVNCIVNAVYCHCKVMSSINFVIEYLGPVIDRLGLTVVEVSP